MEQISIRSKLLKSNSHINIVSMRVLKRNLMMLPLIVFPPYIIQSCRKLRIVQPFLFIRHRGQNLEREKKRIRDTDRNRNIRF